MKTFAESTGCPLARRARSRAVSTNVPADRKDIGLALRLSILENLFLTDMGAVSSFGLVRTLYARARAVALVEEYGIRCHSVDQLVEDLSGGNQQKVSVAKWATRELHTLFLDDPTRGVDVGSAWIYRFMRQFAGKGRGVLVASSDPAEIASVCDRTIVLKDGPVSRRNFRGDIEREHPSGGGPVSDRLRIEID